MSGDPRRIEGESGAQRTLGYVLDLGGGDGCGRCSMVVDHRHTNRHGVLHGGFATSLLDSAMGGAASLHIDPAGMAPVLTLSMTVNFLASGRAGDALMATGRVTGGGTETMFVDATLETDDGRLIATATGVFRRLPSNRVS